jgi:hypothetical protein
MTARLVTATHALTPFQAAADKALRRAARRARALAQTTNTPLVLWKDGRVTRVKVKAKV